MSVALRIDGTWEHGSVLCEGTEVRWTFLLSSAPSNLKIGVGIVEMDFNDSTKNATVPQNSGLTGH